MTFSKDLKFGKVILKVVLLCSMNFKEAEQVIIQECASLYSEGELKECMKRIAEHLTHKSYMEIRLNPAIELDETEFKNIVAQLKTHKPIQYILGFEWFGHLQLKVNEQVLIPRPETEELVRWIKEAIDSIERNQADKKIQVLDIGTGSGCIPIWLKSKCPHIEMTAMDISKGALAIALENSDRYDVGIEFIKADILDETLILNTRFDIIISNPPYITLDEKNEMEANVLDFEPDIALFVSNQDPLQFYKAIFHFARVHLTDKGFLFFEVGKQHALEVKNFFDQQGLTTELRKDMYGNERMLKVWK
jgi:release factor glutamine methyltransferase